MEKNQGSPPVLKKDNAWRDMKHYTEKNDVPKTPEELWADMSSRHLEVLPPSVYAGSLLSITLCCVFNLIH